MTAVVATMLGVVAVASVVLGYVVWRLRSQVDALSVHVLAVSSQLQAASQAASPSALVPTSGAGETRSHPDIHDSGATADGVESAEGRRLDPAPERVEPVVSITDISDDRPDEAAVSRVVSVTMAGPLIKVVALSHGVRRALNEESRMRIGYAIRRELKRQRKLRRRQSLRRAAGQGRRP